MIEARNLVKIYKPKRGVPVYALNDISLKLPQTGMVFILGKSGSGKSTLLNVLGGLDGFDSGEIVIKGQSASSFKQVHYDSYRNTYIGFIFQEYNILDEFTVGANIALAIELQGRKATDEEINKILKEVDLEGFGMRRPNELSGGQKQRVAIARALVKHPEIIMADEPTGALDSKTGKQVFDTLKSLSKDKLVLIVSHDREFAENYADRIIELADGKIIADDSITNRKAQKEEQQISYNGTEIKVNKGYHLTPEDLVAINHYLDNIGSDTKIVQKEKSNNSFIPTKQEEIVVNNDGYDLIKSKLPLKRAFVIGASSLKHKKFKLVTTIFLSFIAFTLFGLADTIASYNRVTAETQSIYDEKIDYATFVKNVKSYYGIEDDDYSWTNDGSKISEDEVKFISEHTGIEIKGVYNPGSLLFKSQIAPGEASPVLYDRFANEFSGLVEFGNDDLSKYNYTLLAGNLPSGSSNEIAISKYVYESFARTGFISYENWTDDKGIDHTTKKYEIKNYEDILGKKLELSFGTMTITGVVDTKFNISKFEMLDTPIEKLTSKDQIVAMLLMSELQDVQTNSLHAVAFVGNKYIENHFPKDKETFRSSGEFGFLHIDNNVFNAYEQNVNKICSRKNYEGRSYCVGDASSTELSDHEILLSSYYMESRASYLYNIMPNDSEWTDILSHSDNEDDQMVLKLDQDAYYGLYHLNDLDVSNGDYQLYISCFINKNIVAARNYLASFGVDTSAMTTYQIIESIKGTFYDFVRHLRNDASLTEEVINAEFLSDARTFVESFIARHNDVYKGLYSKSLFDNMIVHDDTYGYASQINVVGLNAIVKTSIGSYISMDDLFTYTSNRCEFETVALMNTAFNETIHNFTNVCDIVNAKYSTSYNDITLQFLDVYYNYFSILTNCFDTHALSADETSKVNTEISRVLNVAFDALNVKDNPSDSEGPLDSLNVLVRNDGNHVKEYQEFKIKGVFVDDTSAYSLVLDDAFYSKYTNNLGVGVYTYAVGAMPTNKKDIKTIVKFGLEDFGNRKYSLSNVVSYELNITDEILDALGKVFLFVGIFFAIFAIIMLSNFIATSINYKKQDIGILRAIGSRSNDVFRIFLSESTIIAAINFVLATIGTVAISLVINAAMRNKVGLNITLLTFGIRQVGLLLVICLGIAYLATLLPVKKIASKKPIDAIRKR